MNTNEYTAMSARFLQQQQQKQPNRCLYVEGVRIDKCKFNLNMRFYASFTLLDSEVYDPIKVFDSMIPSPSYQRFCQHHRTEIFFCKF